jgi:hypothetical protein
VSSVDAWLFRIAVAVVTFFATTYGCRYVGRYLHQKEANERAHRERAYEEELEDARYLAKGFNDTQGYRDLEHKLSLEEMTNSYASPHYLEQNSVKIAGGAALVLMLLVGESALLYARKRESQRQMSRKR